MWYWGKGRGCWRKLGSGWGMTRLQRRAMCAAALTALVGLSGCAADGICRAPTEGFQAPVRLSTASASWLSSTDFDGDGRSDVISVEQPDQLQQGHFTLHYFDEDLRLEESRLFPRVTTRPVAYKPPHDAKSDLIFSNFRIGMVPGRSDREWVPATFRS